MDNTLERQRGITIQTGITLFSGKYEGEHHRHARTYGFLAEVYRSLSLLEAAHEK